MSLTIADVILLALELLTKRLLHRHPQPRANLPLKLLNTPRILDIHPAIKRHHLLLLIQEVQIHNPLPAFFLDIEKQDSLISEILGKHEIVSPLLLDHLVLDGGSDDVLLEGF